MLHPNQRDLSVVTWKLCRFRGPGKLMEMYCLKLGTSYHDLKSSCRWKDVYSCEFKEGEVAVRACFSSIKLQIKKKHFVLIMFNV